MKLKKTLPSLITGILFLILGIVFIVLPDSFATTVGLIAGISLIVIGVLILFFGIFISRFAFSSLGTMLLSIIMIGFGISFCSNGKIIVTIVPIFLLIYLIVNGFSKIVNSLNLKNLKYKYWWVNLIVGIVYVALGISFFFVLNYLDDIIGIIVGSLFVIIGASSIIDFVIKFISGKYIDKGDDYIKDRVKQTLHKTSTTKDGHDVYEERSTSKTSKANEDKFKSDYIDGSSVIDGEIVSKEDKTSNK